MYFFNLSLMEFMGLFSAVSATALALYLLDRSRRKLTVATLRFWQPSERPPETRHRRQIQQPWSLLMQIAGMALLLLAIAQLRLGSPDRTSRDHVLLLDTSAWMAAREGSRRLIDEAKANAIRWVRSLPGEDRVMVVRADALPTPATVFETNRTAVEMAILQSSPGSASLNLQAAIEFARRMQRQHGQGTGEIVVAGAARTHEADTPPEAGLPPTLRFLNVKEPARNVGIRRFHLRRSQTETQLWEVFVAVRNYGPVRENVPLAVTFGSAPIGTTLLTVAPNAEETARFEFRTKAAGWAEARIQVRDALAEDNRATLELPEQKPVRVLLYSREPENLRPLMAANPRIAATYATPEAYQPDADADVLILDRFQPSKPPVRKSVWIEPPQSTSSSFVAKAGAQAKFTRWRTDHPLAAGLRSLDLNLTNATLFKTAPSYDVVAEGSDGPLVLASNTAPRAVYLGFHPGRPPFRYELAAPLLVANIFEWLAPEVFRRWEINGESAGTVRVRLDPNIDTSKIEVLDEQRQPLPFSVAENALQFYSGQPGLVTVRTGSSESVYSLALPDVAESPWNPPSRVRRGLGGVSPAGPPIHDLWPWLALLGAAILVAEWLLYGRIRFQSPGRHEPLPDLLARVAAPFRKAS
jgi:hypothetical protein